jgi:hypothetical protein
MDPSRAKLEAMVVLRRFTKLSDGTTVDEALLAVTFVPLIAVQA